MSTKCHKQTNSGAIYHAAAYELAATHLDGADARWARAPATLR